MWKKQQQQQKLSYKETTSTDLNIFCWRAYDTIWALTRAVEKIQFPEVGSYEKKTASCTSITNLRISEAGPGIVKELMKTRFHGLSGEFKLKHRQSKAAAFEIINIVGSRDITVGYWTKGKGYSRRIVSAGGDDHGVVYSEGIDGVLKPIIWPGESTKKPKGWDVAGLGQKLIEGRGSQDKRFQRICKCGRD